MLPPSYRASPPRGHVLGGACQPYNSTATASPNLHNDYSASFNLPVRKQAFFGAFGILLRISTSSSIATVFKLTEDLVHDIPSYAILSHTWGPDTEEVTFRDLVDGTGKDKIGYEKIKFCAEKAKRDSIQYFWVDTCCIDKSNNTELSTAINSMFRWYQNAARCYVYLSGISATGYEDSQQSELAWESAFRAHRWFTRGWTLQELLAPASVEFFTQDGRRLGDKKCLEQQIHEITGIAVPALRGSDLSQFDVEERFKWAETRQTTHEEDWAYCLLGIFGVFMPLIYGEGKSNAVRRLKREIADAISRDDAPNRQGAKDRTWMVPFEQNPSFTGREFELESLRQMLFTGYRTAKVAITGLGGVGKTQLALELVYRIRAEHKNCSVIWIPATSKESLGQAYLNAAGQLGISGYEDDKADVKRLVRDHLSSESAGQWLLVFDNADDVGMWVSKSTPESGLIDCLPRSSYGSIIFTTRDKKTAVTLAGRNVVEISEMDEAGGKQLLEKYLVDQDLLKSKGDATVLLARLTYLPLAIVQAAVYINANGIGLGDYLSLLEEQEEDVIDLLSEDFEDEGRYRDVKNPVATTWLISFDQIRQRDPLAADYLSFMACVDPKDIPQSLLPPGQSRKKEIDAMGTLQGYSFLAKRSADSALNIHRLVHLATRNWLRKEGLLPGWTGRVIARLAEVMGDVGHDNRVAWRSYMPHAYYALRSRLTGEDDEDRLNLLWKYGICLDYDGRYREAEAPFERVVEIYKTKLGADHPDTLTSMANLASTFRKQGRWEEAEELQGKELEICTRVLGPRHPDTLTSMANLALTFWDQGRWEEAEKLGVQVMEIRKTKLGADHPDTLTSMNNLALTYWKQGRWEEAEKLGMQAMESYKTKLGADHPDTLTSMDNLALTYRKQGRWEEAEKLGMQVMETFKTKLGADHPDTLTSMANLALTYRAQGRWEEAEELGMQVMEIRKTKLGADHPDTLTSMANLALTYRSQGRWEEAEELQAKELEISPPEFSGTLLGFDDYVNMVLEDVTEFDYSGNHTKLSKILLNGNNICMLIPGGEGPVAT
ncbi:hypothetical protein DL771_007820 [Monosporascus sp. 5C6A]|nr:hypothetical protein DL771_007820 [Monosporascus sp. 5C6A]